jgi:hypothetical protein
VRRVLVVGAGIAGTAAALAAAGRGASVSMVALGSGATRLAGGAFDLEPWEEAKSSSRIGDDERTILDALGAFVAPSAGALVATLAGILRPARAIDRALLDLGPLHDGDVLLPSSDLFHWDADALARAFSESPEANARRLKFAALPVSLVRHVEEREWPDTDVAALHDVPERLEWLSARLSSALPAHRPVALLLPAWLGIEHPRAETLTARLGVPCGEAVTGLGGPSGVRFERARDRALETAGISRSTGRIVALKREALWQAQLDSGSSVGPVEAVALALGGLVGGGLDYCPSGSVLATELPPAPGPLLRATIDAPLVLGMGGSPLETPSSLFGAAPESHAWPFVSPSVLERGGVLVDHDGRVRGAPAGLFACGDLVADRPRTWLEALSLGARAGAAAARD